MLQIVPDTVRTHTLQQHETAMQCNAMQCMVYFRYAHLRMKPNQTKPNAQYTPSLRIATDSRPKPILISSYIHQTKNEIEINWVWINFTHHGNSCTECMSVWVCACTVVNVDVDVNSNRIALHICDFDWKWPGIGDTMRNVHLISVLRERLTRAVLYRIGPAELMEWFFN